MDENTRILLRVLDKVKRLERDRERKAQKLREENLSRRIRYLAYKAREAGDYPQGSE